MASDLEQRLHAVERITELFRFERMVYLCVTVLSFLVILGSGICVLIRDGPTAPVLLPFFGSSGLITYSTGRLLRMWDEALKRIVPDPGSEA